MSKKPETLIEQRERLVKLCLSPESLARRELLIKRPKPKQLKLFI